MPWPGCLTLLWADPCHPGLQTPCPSAPLRQPPQEHEFRGQGSQVGRGQQPPASWLYIQLSKPLQTQLGKVSVVCSKKCSLVIASLLSLNLAVTIHFRKSLFFLWKSNRLRIIFRLMALGREIAKPSWSIILNIPSPPPSPSMVEAGAASPEREMTECTWRILRTTRLAQAGPRVCPLSCV